MRSFNLILAGLFIISSLAWSTPTPAKQPQLQSIPLSLRFDYQPVFTPDEPALGLMGIHILARSPKTHLYGGVGLYGAIHGQYGGLFALGGDVGWQHHFIWPTMARLR